MPRGRTPTQLGLRTVTHETVAAGTRETATYMWKTGAIAGGLAVAAFLALAIAIVSDDDFGKWY